MLSVCFTSARKREWLNCFGQTEVGSRSQEARPRVGLIQLAATILDTIHYGGATTTYDALASAKPIVTLSGSDQRGRYATACYRQMGITDCVARSTEEYVAIASRLGMEPDYRRAVVEKLSEASGDLFADGNVVRAYVDVFQTLFTRVGRL